MNIAAAATAAALLSGLAAYGLFRLVLPDVDITALSSLIGLAAVTGGGLGAWAARRATNAKSKP